MDKYERQLIVRDTPKKGCKRGHPKGERKKFLDSFLKTSKTAKDIKSAVQQAIVQQQPQEQARPPKRSKSKKYVQMVHDPSKSEVKTEVPQYQGLPNMPQVPNLPQVPYPMAQPKTEVPFQNRVPLPSMVPPTKNEVPYPNQTTYHPGVPLRTEVGPLTPPSDQEDLEALLQEYSPDSKMNPHHYPNLYSGMGQLPQLDGADDGFYPTGYMWTTENRVPPTHQQYQYPMYQQQPAQYYQSHLPVPPMNHYYSTPPSTPHGVQHVQYQPQTSPVNYNLMHPQTPQNPKTPSIDL